MSDTANGRPAPWAGSTRSARLPSDWQARRRIVLARDHRTCRRCGEWATDVDHITAGDDHDLANLQALCGPCHRAKSAREGAAASARVPRPTTRQPSDRRPLEKHPGLLW